MKQLVMMKGAALLACVLMLGSCINERKVLGVFDSEKVTERRAHDGFEKIEILGSPTVYYTQADSFSVSVKGPKSIVEDIITEVDGSTPKIRNRGKIGIFNFTVVDDDETAVYVTSPDLVHVQLSGSGDFVSNNQLDTDVMNIVLRGSGDVSFKDIICDVCTTELVGSGDIRIDYLNAKTSTAVLVGSGDIRITEANVQETDLSLKGSGDISIDFEEGCRSAQCHLAGSGDITLSGTLTHYDCKKSGSGDIHTDDLIVK